MRCLFGRVLGGGLRKRPGHLTGFGHTDIGGGPGAGLGADGQGQADQVILKGDKLVVEKPVRVPGGFRPMGAAFCNIMGKDTRSLAFVDQGNRLQISTEGEDLWRSSTSVGGGYMEIEQQRVIDLEHARRVLSALQVPGQPKAMFCDAGNHGDSEE